MYVCKFASKQVYRYLSIRYESMQVFMYGGIVFSVFVLKLNLIFQKTYFTSVSCLFEKCVKYDPNNLGMEKTFFRCRFHPGIGTFLYLALKNLICFI